MVLAATCPPRGTTVRAAYIPAHRRIGLATASQAGRPDPQSHRGQAARRSPVGVGTAVRHACLRVGAVQDAHARAPVCASRSWARPPTSPTWPGWSPPGSPGWRSLPGFGRSEPERGFDYRLQSHATALGDFLAGLDRGPLHLVGNSMGGAVVLLVAARHPELVRTLTLISPAMPDLRIDPRRTSDPRFALAFLPLVGGRVLRAIARTSPARRTEQVLRLCFAEPSAVSAVRRAQAEEEFAERQGMEWALAALSRSAEGLVRSWLAPRSRSLWTVAAGVDRPALVVWGTRDRLVSVRKAPRTAAALPRGKLLVLPRTGHVAQMERPETVARAMLGMFDAHARGAW